MKRLMPVALVSAICLMLLAIPAHAQATRTWVSGVGDDANPCSRTAPCKTFAGAISKTAAGGEINVLDPGGYGAVTITKSISIYGAGEAGVLVSGTNGIVITAGASDVVNIRGLVFDGLNTGINGILISSAHRVNIENCVIQEFGTTAGQAGINIASSSIAVKIQNTVIKNNMVGVIVRPTSGTAHVAIERTQMDNNNTDGLQADGRGGGTVHVGLTDSSMSVNGGSGMTVLSGSGSAKVNALRVAFTTNGASGVQVDQSAGGTAAAVIGSSLFSDDEGGAVNAVGGAFAYTLGNNQLSGAGGGGFTGPLSQF